MQNRKKSSKLITLCVIVFVVVLSVGIGVSRAERSFPPFSMQGVNLSDLQSDEIVREVARLVRASEDNIFALSNSTQLWVSGDFDWCSHQTIEVNFTKSTRAGNRVYYCQLRIFPEKDSNFFVTQPLRTEPFAEQYLLRDFLDALRYTAGICPWTDGKSAR